MKKTYGLIVALMLATQSCADTGTDTSTKDPQDEAAQLGNLSLNLTGVDSSGRDYRLRQATFNISSDYFPPFPFPIFGDAGIVAPKTVSSETDPDAPVISVRLAPGSYYVTFENYGWYLERFVNGAWERVEQAVLLSTPYQYAYIYDGGTTAVAFRFGVDGDIIDFRSGELQIGIEIEQPGDEPPQVDGGFPWPEGGWGPVDGGFGADATAPDATAPDAGF